MLSDLKSGEYYLTKGIQIQNKSHNLGDIIDFSEKTGAKLSILLLSIQNEISFLIETEEIIEKALAGPNLTVKILRVLPILAVGLCVLLGGNPIKVYTCILGLICVAIGTIFWVIGRQIIIRKIEKFKSHVEYDLMENPIIQLNLIYVAEQSGLNIITTLKYFFKDPSDFLLKDTPWRLCGFPKHFAFLEKYYYSAQSVSGPIQAHIQILKMQISRDIHVKGEELATQLTLPLSACFLPSFIFFGIIPTIFGLVS